jgi:hypothetical protein
MWLGRAGDIRHICVAVGIDRGAQGAEVALSVVAGRLRDVMLTSKAVMVPAFIDADGSRVATEHPQICRTYAAEFGRPQKSSMPLDLK